MRVVMEFSLPDEAEELRWAQGGPRYRAALAVVRGELRSRIKYRKMSQETRAALQAVYDLLLEEIAAFGEDF